MRFSGEDGIPEGGIKLCLLGVNTGRNWRRTLYHLYHIYQSVVQGPPASESTGYSFKWHIPVPLGSGSHGGRLCNLLSSEATHEVLP